MLNKAVCRVEDDPPMELRVTAFGTLKLYAAGRPMLTVGDRGLGRGFIKNVINSAQLEGRPDVTGTPDFRRWARCLVGAWANIRRVESEGLNTDNLGNRLFCTAPAIVHGWAIGTMVFDPEAPVDAGWNYLIPAYQVAAASNVHVFKRKGVDCAELESYLESLTEVVRDLRKNDLLVRWP